jgi:peptidoglycan-associated lipoprotein
VAKGFVQFSTIMMTAVLVLALCACRSKKATEDATSPGGGVGAESLPQIESTPMNFDASGSDSGRISGLQSINFEYDKSTLSPDAKKKIQGNVEWMKSNPASRMQVEGHCDARGSIEYNLSLGERRANVVKNYMTGLGIPGSRLSVISYGKEKPLQNGDSEADYAKNRRANFVPLSQ